MDTPRQYSEATLTARRRCPGAPRESHTRCLPADLLAPLAYPPEPLAVAREGQMAVQWKPVS